MAVPKDVYGKGPVAVCMVVGCNKKALYKKTQRHRSLETERGYCTEHKGLAATAPPTMQFKANQLDRYLSNKDNRDAD
jgi:hypothetical protein